MKKGLVLLMLMFGSMVFAVVDIASLIRDVQIDGTSERAGTARFIIGADDFALSSVANPIYISIRFDRNALLSETLVDIVGSPMGHDPIALPLGIQTQSATTQANIPADAISIVRWREGEKRIWLKVTASSSTWVSRNGVAGAPSVDDQVSVTLGHTLAESTAQYQDLFDDGLANLVVPTRQGGMQAETSIFLDLTQSNLQAAPHPESILEFDPLALDGSTSGVETSSSESGINSVLFPILFSSDTAIARGVGPSQDRWLHYFSRDRNEFSSHVIFYNRAPIVATMTLRPYDHQGNAFADIEIEVDPFALKTLSADSLFGNLAVTHSQVIGSEFCAVTVTHPTQKNSRLETHVPESGAGLNYWEYFPEDPRMGRDYFVIVNLGNEAATVQAVMLDEHGESIQTKGLFTQNPIPPKGQAIVLLQKLADSPRDVVMMRFNSSEAVGVFALRSNKNGNGSRTIFPVQPITIQN